MLKKKRKPNELLLLPPDPRDSWWAEVVRCPVDDALTHLHDVDGRCSSKGTFRVGRDTSNQNKLTTSNLITSKKF